jgi:CRISPR/Cas system-associated exonuclease Cas4 (RecB family)
LFVTGIRSELVEQVSSEKLEKEFLAHPEIMFKEAQKISEPPLKEKEFLVKRFLERGLSVSALNNYFECPTKFYLLNLVGMREAPNPSAQAGNSAHGALKYAIDSMSLRAERSNLVSKKDFLNRFRFLLSREPMREIDFNEALKKGERALGAYFDEYHKTWNANMKPEYPVEVEFAVDEKITIPLRGRLDRVDLLPTPYNLPPILVRVVDYKFKKPMSRKEIAGLTKTSDGNYYRQLTFYKLLIEEGTKWKMKEASLDFLEPSSAKASEGQDRPRFKQEVFAPSEKEVADLK